MGQVLGWVYCSMIQLGLGFGFRELSFQTFLAGPQGSGTELTRNPVTYSPQISCNLAFEAPEPNINFVHRFEGTVVCGVLATLGNGSSNRRAW